jgi:hypothetical protein
MRTRWHVPGGIEFPHAGFHQGNPFYPVAIFQNPAGRLSIPGIEFFP